MSNIFIASIVGTGTYAVPSTDAELAAATVGLDTHISSIPNLNYSRVIAWVETVDGATPYRTLNCLIENFIYNGEVCPDAIETNTLTAAIKAELEGDANITSVSVQQVSIFTTGPYSLWLRNASSGYLYPAIVTDDVVVGGLSPNGVWFNDGDLVLGAAAMSGTEKLRVVGTSYFEGFIGVNAASVSNMGIYVLTASAGTSIYGIRSGLDTSGNVSNAWYGAYAVPVVNTGHNINTVGNFIAAFFTVNGAITDYYSFYISRVSAGTIIDAYGLYIEDMASSGKSFGIYQNDYGGASITDNYFAGRIGIADDSPSYSLDVNGDINVQTAKAYRFNGVQIINSRKTGWGVPTGTSVRTTFDTATVTLPELAKRVKAFIDDCTSHGLIGA